MTELIKNSFIKKREIYLLLKKIYSTQSLSKKVLWAEWYTEGREIEQTKYLITLQKISGMGSRFCITFPSISCNGKYYDLAIMAGWLEVN